ncbi:MAG: ribosome assembly RNA-binding protein YhbY [Magnetococcales bacterium]|nr:ribosome assembly RNA-binding protein YhbY [Magnetococcales bacterium]
MAMNLSSTQRKYLRALAHPLKPVVAIGHDGVTEAVLAELERALEDHELIKIRFNDFKEEKTSLTEKIAQHTDARQAGMIGHIAILYRPRRDVSKRRILLPQSKEEPPSDLPGRHGTACRAETNKKMHRTLKS